jgi:hypothetical protein
MFLWSPNSHLWPCLCIAVNLAFAADLEAQATFCDPLLEVTTIGDLRYRSRPANSTPSRCEGVFSEGRSGVADVELVGLVGESQDYNPQQTSTVVLEWNSPVVTQVSVRAVGLRRGLHYRMDTRLTAQSFRWPTDVISPLQITREQLGLVAHIRAVPTLRMPQNSRLYLPVRLRRSLGSANNGCFSVIFRVAAELSAVDYSLQYRGASQQEDIGIVNSKDLELPYYPARQPIRFTMPCLQRRGLYSLTIHPTATNHGVTVPDLRIYFYNG